MLPLEQTFFDVTAFQLTVAQRLHHQEKQKQWLTDLPHDKTEVDLI